MPAAVSIRGVSRHFRLYHEAYHSLKERIVHFGRTSYEDFWALRDVDGRLAGYFLLMNAVEDVHLLNITVRPDLQGQGVGRYLLEKVCALAEAAGIHQILLEVRPSNQHALAVYRHAGFQMIGMRKKYYPAAGSAREDAIVMRLKLVQASA